MAENERLGSESVDEDDLIKKLVSDPSMIPDIKVLRGFLGKSNRSGYMRLYLNPELNAHIELQEKDALHVHSLDDGRSPLRGTIVWVAADAKVRHTQTVSREAQALFLEGDIVSAFMRGTSSGTGIGNFGANIPPVQLSALILGCVAVGAAALVAASFAFCPKASSGCPSQANSSNTSCCLC